MGKKGVLLDNGKAARSSMSIYWKAAQNKAQDKAAKKAAPAKKVTALKSKLTKSQILNEIGENTGLSRAQVGSVLNELETLMQRSVKKGSVGEFTVPGAA